MAQVTNVKSSFRWSALILVFVGALMIFIAIQGTQRRVWNALTGKSDVNDPNANANEVGASGNFSATGPTVTPIFGPGGVVGASGDFGVPTSTNYRAIAFQDALHAGIDPNAFVRQIQQESGFNPTAKSPAGAIGIAQFEPSTAAGLGINPLNPTQALQGAANLMSRYVKQYGGEAEALAAYNAGPGALQAAKTRGGSNWRAFLPSETQNYIHTILGS